MNKKIICLFILLALFSGCSNYASLARSNMGYISYTAQYYPAHPEDHYIELFFEGSPEKEYISLGRIDGFVKKDKDIRPLLIEKARQAGGDAVIDIKVDYQKKDVAAAPAMSGGYHYNRAMISTYQPYETIEIYQISGVVIKYAFKKAIVVEKDEK